MISNTHLVCISLANFILLDPPMLAQEYMCHTVEAGTVQNVAVNMSLCANVIATMEIRW